MKELKMSYKERQEKIKEIRKEIKLLEFERRDYERRESHMSSAWSDRNYKIDNCVELIQRLKASNNYGVQIYKTNDKVRDMKNAFEEFMKAFQFYDVDEERRPTKEQFKEYVEKVRVARDRIARYHNLLKELK